MDVGLGWMGVGVGAAGFVLTYLMASAAARGERTAVADEARRTWFAAGLTLVLTVVFWAIGMRTRDPFSLGQTLVWGFLIGGLAGAIMCVLSHRFSTLAAVSSRANSLAINSTIFFGLFATALAYTLFHSYPINAMIGFAMGAVMAGILRTLGGNLIPNPSPERRGESEGAPSPERRGDSVREIWTMHAWAIFSTLVAAGTVLSFEHFDDSTKRWWWPLAILMATTVAVASLVANEIASRRSNPAAPAEDRPTGSGASALLSGLVTCLIVLGLTAIYSWRLFHSWSLLEVAAVGVGIAALSAWMIAVSTRRTSTWGLDSATGCLMLVVAFIVVTFKLWSGLGIAIGLIAAWSVLIPMLALRAPDDETLPKGLSYVLLLGLAALLFRIFIEHGSGLGGGELRVHYTFIGAIIGAMLPLMLASSAYRITNCAQRRQGAWSIVWGLAGAVSVGLIAVAAPIVIFLVWETKAVLGLMFGLVVSCAFLLIAYLFHAGAPPDQRGVSLADRSPALLVIGTQLAAIQFTWPLQEIETTRILRAEVLGVAAVLALVWFLVTGICSSRGER